MCALSSRMLYRHRCQSFRVGIGSIRRIVTAIAAARPGIRLHLFGAKLEVMKGWGNLPRPVISCDSANEGAGQMTNKHTSSADVRTP